MILDKIQQAQEFARPFEQRAPVPDEFPASSCEHAHVTVYKHVGGSPIDDHSTQWSFCNDCSEWIVTSDFANGRRDEHPMKPCEIAQFEAEAVSSRRSEWLEDFQAGVQ